jgi:two-component system response regulator FlrC
VNCAAIPEQMLEALLFGHEKGAFTGAQARSTGKFVQANGGTILLDEITEMELSLQAKLLRVLQEREVEPLGASKPVALDVRVLATSNRDLEQTVRDGEFREDLYYRLSVFPLQIPPLRERPGDVVALARRFVAARGGANSLSDAAISRLVSYAWPGNVRELENAMQRALLLCDAAGVIEPQHLVLDERARVAPNGAAFGGASAPVGNGAMPAPAHAASGFGAPPAGLADGLWEEETRRIVTALASSRGREQAAEMLGISGRTLRYKLQKMRKAGIHVPGGRA